MRNTEMTPSKGRRRKLAPTKYAAPGKSVILWRGVNMELKMTDPRIRLENVTP